MVRVMDLFNTNDIIEYLKRELSKDDNSPVVSISGDGIVTIKTLTNNLLRTLL